MFNFKHEIELVTKEKIWLFGEDYYNDKRMFFESHQTQLNNLRLKARSNGFPIIIRDLQFNIELSITSSNQFIEWLKMNQPTNY